jgi:tellurite resistance protein
MDLHPEVNLSHTAAEAIARGLYAVAKIDGMHAREASLVASFWGDIGGGAAALAELERRPAIQGPELAATLSSPDERSLFLKTALLLAWADGQVTPAERKLIEQYAQALGVGVDGIAKLEEGVKDFLMGHVAHLANTDASRAVAQKLKV